MKLRLKNKLRILAKLNIDSAGIASFGKLSTALTQSGVQEASLIDDSLELIARDLTGYDKLRELSNFELLLPLDLQLWGSRTKKKEKGKTIELKKSSDVTLHFFYLERLFKIYLDYFKKDFPIIPFQLTKPFKSLRLRQLKFAQFYRLLYLKFSLLAFTSVDLAGGVYYDLDLLFQMSRTFPGRLISYKDRQEMKARKINFRRKVRKQKLEEY